MRSGSEPAGFTALEAADTKAPVYKDQVRIPEFEAVRLSGLFDAMFYENGLNAAGVVNDGLALVEHYVTHGEAARIAPNPLFDVNYYVESNPDVQSAGMSALVHFIQYGVNERRNPHPLVDVALLKQQFGPKPLINPLTAYLSSRGPRLRPHELIDPDYIWTYQTKLAPGDQRPCLLFYLEQDSDLYNPSPGFDAYSYSQMYNDLEGMHPLVHFVRYGKSKGRRVVAENESLMPGRARGDPQGSIYDQIEAAANLDPDVIAPFADPAAIPVFVNYSFERVEYRLWARLRAVCGARDYTHVILAPWLKRGGAERVIVNLARALVERDAAERVLILCTTSPILDAAGWAPLSDRVTIAAIDDVVDDANNTFIAFCNFLRFVHCRHLYVVNSEFGWRLVERYGHVLRRFVAAHGFVFCYEYDDSGRRAGFAWTHLRAAGPWLSALVSDNARVIDQLAADHHWRADDREAFFSLPQPTDPALAGWMTEQLPRNLSRAYHGRPMVLWAARADRQKGIEVARDIAVGAPDIDFALYGVDPPEDEVQAALWPENVRMCGAFERFADLPLHEASAFLHTSHWDGLPNVLLEAGAAGLPIVATDVGGVAEIVDADTGWLIPHGSGAHAYIDAIRDVLGAPGATLEKTRRMSVRLAQTHSPKLFADAVSRLLEFAERRRRQSLEGGV